MALLDGKQFSKITRRYRCDDAVLKQIREFIVTSMSPDEDIILNHCPVIVNDLSKRFFIRTRQTRYFDVGFHVMYYQIWSTFVGEPVLEITYDAAEEVSNYEYEHRMTEQKKASILLSVTEAIINPSYIE